MSLAKLSVIGVALAAVALPRSARAEDFHVAYTTYRDVMAHARTDWQPPPATFAATDAGVADFQETVAYADLFAMAPAMPVGSARATALAPSSPEDGERVRERYPRAVLQRPAIAPLGVIIGSADAAGGADPASVELGLNAGLPFRADLVTSYRRANVAEGRESIALGVGRSLWDNRWLSFATRSRLELSLDGNTPTTTRSGLRAAAILGSHVGVWMRPEQLAIDVDGSEAPRLILPLSLGLQVTGTIWTQLDADIALAEIHPDGFAPLARETVPAALSAVYSVSRRFDLRARVGASVTRAGVVTPSTTYSLGLAYILGR